MTNKTILIPTMTLIDTDFLAYAKALATEQDASLLILYITSPLTLTNYYSYPSMLYSVAHLNMDNVNVAHETFSHTLDTLLGDFPHDIKCLVGPTTDTILNVAEERNVDLILVEGPPHASSKTALKHKLAKKTAIPVVVYPS